jgi:hypothetical protein
MKSVDGIYEMYLRDLQGILNYCTKGFEKVALAELERLGLDVKDLALEEINKLINYIVSGQKNKPENKEECERSVLEWRELMRKKEDK